MVRKRKSLVLLAKSGMGLALGQVSSILVTCGVAAETEGWSPAIPPLRRKMQTEGHHEHVSGTVADEAPRST